MSPYPPATPQSPKREAVPQLPHQVATRSVTYCARWSGRPSLGSQVHGRTPTINARRHGRPAQPSDNGRLSSTPPGVRKRSHGKWPTIAFATRTRCPVQRVRRSEGGGDPAAARREYKHGPGRGRCLPVPARLVGGGFQQGSPRLLVAIPGHLREAASARVCEAAPSAVDKHAEHVGLDEDLHAVVDRPAAVWAWRIGVRFAAPRRAARHRSNSETPMLRREACPVNKLPLIHLHRHPHGMPRKRED